jgi:hypothetical protein
LDTTFIKESPREKGAPLPVDNPSELEGSRRRCRLSWVIGNAGIDTSFYSTARLRGSRVLAAFGLVLHDIKYRFVPVNTLKIRSHL